MAVIATLVLVGTGMRIYNQAALRPMPRCGAEWFLRGELPAQRLTKDQSHVWHWARNIVTAPATGLTDGYARARDMGLCTTGSLTIAFLPSKQATSGTTVGHIFLTRGRPGLKGIGAQALALHESRHVDQWTVLTLAGGPLALPVLYTVDETFFPGARNHFERGAGLVDGGYDQPASFGPKPVWAGVVLLGLLLLLLARRRVRWLSRVARAGRTGASRAEPGRCAVHTRGWFRVA
ncbi:MAG: hypothetical protein ACRDMV_09565 [Streptosporangiales bacterium]